MQNPLATVYKCDICKKFKTDNSRGLQRHKASCSVTAYDADLEGAEAKYLAKRDLKRRKKQLRKLDGIRESHEYQPNHHEPGPHQEDMPAENGHNRSFEDYVPVSSTLLTLSTTDISTYSTRSLMDSILLPTILPMLNHSRVLSQRPQHLAGLCARSVQRGSCLSFSHSLQPPFPILSTIPTNLNQLHLREIAQNLRPSSGKESRQLSIALACSENTHHDRHTIPMTPFFLMICRMHLGVPPLPPTQVLQAPAHVMPHQFLIHHRRFHRPISRLSKITLSSH